MKNYRKSKWYAAAALLLAGILSGSMMVSAADTQETENETAGGTYAFISKSLGNPYNFAMADGFQEVVEAAGGECVVNHPMNPYADDQITIIDSLISQQVDAIAIAANDETRLTESLNEAKEAGIQVITLDSDTDPSARTTFCNQADTELIAQTMMDAIYDIAGGEGEYAILSTTTYATNQNAWLDAMADVAASPAADTRAFCYIGYLNVLHIMGVDETYHCTQLFCVRRAAAGGKILRAEILRHPEKHTPQFTEKGTDTEFALKVPLMIQLDQLQHSRYSRKIFRTIRTENPNVQRLAIQYRMKIFSFHPAAIHPGKKYRIKHLGVQTAFSFLLRPGIVDNLRIDKRHVSRMKQKGMIRRLKTVCAGHYIIDLQRRMPVPAPSNEMIQFHFQAGIGKLVGQRSHNLLSVFIQTKFVRNNHNNAPPLTAVSTSVISVYPHLKNNKQKIFLQFKIP